MNYVISDPEMQTKVARAIRQWDGRYTFDDIMYLIKVGRMQSFTYGDTWIITQVNDFPRKRVLEVACVIGFIGEAIEALPDLYDYAKSIGASQISGFGREGWWGYRALGWRKFGTMFVKDL